MVSSWRPSLAEERFTLKVAVELIGEFHTEVGDEPTEEFTFSHIIRIFATKTKVMRKDNYEEALDTLLAEFARKKFISRDELPIITNGIVCHKDEMLPFLVEDSMLNECYNGFNITARGCVFCRKGGYKAVRRKERLTSFLVWLTAVCSVIAAIASVLTIILA